MGIVATGQVSIIDYTDAPSLSSFITSNLPKTQLFDTPNNKTIPDWGAAPNLILTPSLFIAGTPDDKISDVNVKSATWYDLDAPTTAITTAGNFVVGNKAAKFTLTIKANIMTDAITSKTYICDIVYTDPTSGFDLRIKADITFSRMKNGATGNTGAAGADAVFVTAWAPDGNLFKNDAGGQLTAQVDTYKGGGVVTGTYEWFVQTTGNADEGAGLGWKKITTTNQADLGFVGSPTAASIKLEPKAVLNVTSLKVKVVYGGKTYFDTVTFIDQTDPIQVTVISSNGEIFKNGQITTELTARLFQNGAEIDTAGTAYKYKWTARDRNGNQVAGFSKTTKKITVTNTDVTQRATFIVEIES